jgi:hypothetical protein
MRFIIVTIIVSLFIAFEAVSQNNSDQGSTQLIRSNFSVPKNTIEIKKTWSAHNGNGTYTNPIFYEEFPDPDLIRVGDHYYLTGTRPDRKDGSCFVRTIVR